MIINLAEETIAILHLYFYNENDIAWIGNREYTVPIDEFFDVAMHTNYNNGYGSPAIAGDLLIVMKDNSYFQRREYDGSEWWEYIPIVKKPSEQKHFNCKSFADIDIEYHVPNLKYYVI